MSTSRPPDEPIRERFPFLWKSDDTPDDVRADLDLTDTALGTQYRRGKQTRLNRYQQLEDALALQDARDYREATAPIFDVLGELLGGASTLLDAPGLRGPFEGGVVTFEARPANESTVQYILSTVEIGKAWTVGAHRLDAVLPVMSGLDLDETNVNLFREVICCLEPPTSLSAISKRHGPNRKATTRQAMSVRRQRLVRRLVRTRGEFAIAALERVVHERLKTVTRWPAGDPFLSIALSTPDQKFPTAVDAVRLGLWLASPKGHGEMPGGFVLGDEGKLIPR